MDYCQPPVSNFITQRVLGVSACQKVLVAQSGNFGEILLEPQGAMNIESTTSKVQIKILSHEQDSSSVCCRHVPNLRESRKVHLRQHAVADSHCLKPKVSFLLDGDLIDGLTLSPGPSPLFDD